MLICVWGPLSNFVLVVVGVCAGGGRPPVMDGRRSEQGWLVVRAVPMLISVHDPGWFRAGDMMVMGFPLGGSPMRSLSLWRPSTRTWQQRKFGSWPLCIG
jgi:hypothetical protein